MRKNIKKTVLKIFLGLCLLIIMSGIIHVPPAKASAIDDAVKGFNKALEEVYRTLLGVKGADEEFRQRIQKQIEEGIPQIDKSAFLQNVYQVEIVLSPENPGANEPVKTTVKVFGFDPDAAYFKWTINGQAVLTGYGKKSIEFTTGNIGSQTSISVFILTSDETSLQKTKTINVGEIDLLWQASTYAPPFYKGKVEPVKEGQIKITAIPHGLGLGKNLIYEWSRNSVTKRNASGVGRNSHTFHLSYLSNEERIGVKISDTNKTFSVEKTIKIKPKTPEIIFYEDRPIEGPLYHKALSREIELTQEEIIIHAEPYFLPKDDLPAFSYTWRVNNEKTDPLSKPNIIGLSVPAGTSGKAIVELQINNYDPRKYFLGTTGKIYLSF